MPAPLMSALACCRHPGGGGIALPKRLLRPVHHVERSNLQPGSAEISVREGAMQAAAGRQGAAAAADGASKTGCSAKQKRASGVAPAGGGSRNTSKYNSCTSVLHQMSTGDTCWQHIESKGGKGAGGAQQEWSTHKEGFGCGLLDAYQEKLKGSDRRKNP